MGGTKITMFDFREYRETFRYWARDAHGREYLYQREPWLNKETGEWEFFNGRVTLRGECGEPCESVMVARNKPNPPTQSVQGG